MVRTNDGFEIAEVDLRLRGPGDIMGTQQSGVLNLRIADIVKDNAILKELRRINSNSTCTSSYKINHLEGILIGSWRN